MFEDIKCSTNQES